MELQQPEIIKLNALIHSIEENPAIGNSTLQLARVAGMSALRFRKVFKAHTGLTVQQFLTATKMKKAATLLKSELSIKEISSLLGYADLPSFYRSFTKFYRCTPLQFIKRSPGAEPHTS